MKRHFSILSLIAASALLALSAPASATHKSYDSHRHDKHNLHDRHYKQGRYYKKDQYHKRSQKRHARDTIWIGSFGRLHSWQAVGRDKILLWASPSRPYLVHLHRPIRSLKFAHRIGVRSRTGRISRFDSIIVDGRPVPIRSIRALDRSQARHIRSARRF